MTQMTPFAFTCWLFLFAAVLVPTQAMTMDRLKQHVAVAAQVEASTEAQEQVSAAAPISITGVASGGGLGSLTGTFAPITSTVGSAVGGVLGSVILLTGPLVGTVTGLAGGATQSVTQTVSLLLDTITGDCTGLTLNTGTTTVNILGTNIDLSPITVDVAADSGAGALLGTLLCTVGSLLSSLTTTAGGLVSLSGLTSLILAPISALLAAILSIVFGVVGSTGGLL